MIICLCPLIGFGQIKDSITIQLFTPDVISEATLDQKPFLEWFGKVQQAVQIDIAEMKGNKELYIVLTAHKDKDVTISIGADPKFLKKQFKS